MITLKWGTKKESLTHFIHTESTDTAVFMLSMLQGYLSQDYYIIKLSVSTKWELANILDFLPQSTSELEEILELDVNDN